MCTHSEKYRLKKTGVDTFVCPGRMRAAAAEPGAQTVGLRRSVLPRCAVRGPFSFPIGDKARVSTSEALQTYPSMPGGGH